MTRIRSFAWRRWLFLSLVAAWIVSVFLAAFDLRHILPPGFRHYGNVTHLFTRRVDSWSWFELQGRFTGGEGRWVGLRLSDYSRMENYGYLTRLDRILGDAGRPVRGRPIRRDLARHLAGAHARRFPESPALREVRFLRVSAPVGSGLLSNPPGRWVRPPLETVPRSWVREIAVVSDREWSAQPEPTR
ncbi:MAG: hypothetical protein WD342_16705 [Verrucomicrobiales bacterium]